MNYIGLPFAPGGRGPAEVDCWGLIFYVYAQEFNIALHPLPGLNILTCDMKRVDSVIAQEVAAEWVECPAPVEGCVVAMGHNKILHHVGLYTAADGGRVIHAREGQNVVADTLKSLRLKGVRLIKFYQHTKWPGSS